MALGSLISLAFWTTRLAADVWPFAEKINDPNHIRGPNGQAFPLPSETHLLPGTLRSVLRPLDCSPSSADSQIEAEASAVVRRRANVCANGGDGARSIEIVGVRGGSASRPKLAWAKIVKLKQPHPPRRRRRFYLAVQNQGSFFRRQPTFMPKL